MMSENKKCACKGDNLDRFIQPIVLLILLEEADTGYGILKKMSNFSMFRDSRPDATGVYRYLRTMAQKGLLEQFEYKEDENKYKMKYRITEEGKSCLANWENTLSGYAEAIIELVTFMKSTTIQ
ncbi:MAG: PadR family transcriptional regulator [Eubacterium sp.]|nr:PadR family transcriptional regulator [Eubacterium sp.]